ncbi:Transketolase, thiamine diphosphate binding domain-containing protein [Fusarium oxysporum Fo47]|uniref:Transketolase, thiamine diphosphate binding domain-containing protein n=1 Tax=Fusarium oxysporum Fo47 TaxID=660027 RepID=UPI002869A376|nr:Transketolase, thiamine diphosphate binding domain-containing protein [Fusarium oxysporum Fo47]WJG35737.1 Transketolase, thiamine diphosphate binding domain-domain-containing protein [Fusarium oxysporum Fo47]
MEPIAITPEAEEEPVALSNVVKLIKNDDAETMNLALRQFRCLIADICEYDYLNRDRFVLSNCHTCLFQYTFLHLTGYKAMTFEHLKSYHSSNYDSLAPGHPDIEHEGHRHAVGLAMATKNLAAAYNKPNFDLVNNTTFCMIGVACLQEGVALEAIQLAGHWKLNNLVVMYDHNQITCDGSVDLCNTEDVNAKMRACGWDGIVNALLKAKASTDKPTFINIHTVIGVSSKVAGDAKAHGAAFSPDGVRAVKEHFGMDPEKHYVVSDEVYNFFRDRKTRGDRLVEDWKNLLDAYGKEYPELHEEFIKRVECRFTEDWRSIITAKESLPTAPTPSRKSAGIICNPLNTKLKDFMVGTADLSPSVNMIWKDKVDFQHPDLKTTCGINDSYSSRYIHWGTILPVTCSFFMFYIYAAPGVLMGALQNLQAIHVATHDSIGTGEDGQGQSLHHRSFPQSLEQYPQYSSREGAQKGAYVFVEEENADVALIGVGAEIVFAIKTREVLIEKFAIKASSVSANKTSFHMMRTPR